MVGVFLNYSSIGQWAMQNQFNYLCQENRIFGIRCKLIMEKEALDKEKHR